MTKSKVTDHLFVYLLRELDVRGLAVDGLVGLGAGVPGTGGIDMKKYELEYGGQFLKDLKLAKRRNLNMKDLSDITDLLQEGRRSQRSVVIIC